jgi:ABC-type multidrug transport system fused ATPase/permease subunit
MQAAQAAGELHQKLAEHLMKVRSALHTMDQARFTYHWGSNGLDASKRVSLRFEDVSFGYSGGNVGEPVLKNFSLSIPAGEHVALVGRNGAGKSTLLNLIMRFDEPQDGRIFIGNSELHMLTKKGLYSAIGYVPQDAKLMNSSIEENLFYFNDHVTTERTDAVFRAVGIPAVIRRRPDGLCARVGELGDQLSGGERQRIAIARALLREGAVYLMDEPTSSIEDDDALQVVRNVRELLRGKTMLFVTHSPQIENMFENVVRVEAGSAVWERSRFNGPHRAE